MKLKTEYVNGYIVLVDKSVEIKEDSLFIDLETKDILTCHGFAGGKQLAKAPISNAIVYPNKEFIAAIIFAEKKLNLNVPLLPNWRELYQVGEYVLRHFNDSTRSRVVEIKAVNYSDNSKPIGVWLGGGWVKFEEIEKLPTYNKAKYTEEDLLIIRNKFVDLLPTGDVTAWDMIQAIKDYTQWFDNYVQSLQKYPKYIVMESEDCFVVNSQEYIHSSGAKGNYSTHNKKLKLITNSEGKQQGIIKEIIW